MKEIFEALLAGKKIGSKDWMSHEYIYLDDKGFLREEGGELSCDITFNSKMTIYEEPKKKVKLFLWAVPGKDCYPYLNTNFMTEEEAKVVIGEDAIKTNISITVEI